MSKLYELCSVGKSFAEPVSVSILEDLNFSLDLGERLAIIGASGSGKSTLLHLLGALDQPSQGKIFFQGQDFSQLSPTELAIIRNKYLGFVFQFHHLLPEFSAIENVAMPALIRGESLNKVLPLAREMLASVGLKDKDKQRVATLSGGERQRVAIARAILSKPQVLLADEPTGNLDNANAELIGELLLELNAKLNMALIIVTHNQELAQLMGKAMELRAGRLYDHYFE